MGSTDCTPGHGRIRCSTGSSSRRAVSSPWLSFPRMGEVLRPPLHVDLDRQPDRRLLRGDVSDGWLSQFLGATQVLAGVLMRSPRLPHSRRRSLFRRSQTSSSSRWPSASGARRCSPGRCSSPRAPCLALGPGPIALESLTAKPPALSKTDRRRWRRIERLGPAWNAPPTSSAPPAGWQSSGPLEVWYSAVR